MIFISFIGLLSCVEEFVPESITFEDLLVVEASLTNEIKYHEIKLSRTFQFSEEPVVENQARVRVIDDMQNEYVFNETESGTYVSAIEFGVVPERIYTLKIVTKNNKSYSSIAVKPPSDNAQISDVSFVNDTNSDGIEGISILVDSYDPTGNSEYYRYDFEETQRIVAPFYADNDMVIVSDTPPFKVELKRRTEEKRTCYKTTISKSQIVQTQTKFVAEDRVTKFPVKFISKTDSIIRDRYSILVKQYVQNFEAYTYFQNLNDFSSSENVFSENQPGFIESNIISDTNPNEKILGFFEINSVSEKRLFIDHQEAFPNENQLPYFVECATSTPYLTDPEDPSKSPLIEMIKDDVIRFWLVNEDFFGNPIENPPYTVVNTPCGDCTFYASNVKPDFWVD
ncbi:DUF4249 domain-containing protein [Algibacter mikhailovii]|uniref:DUF4249 domain-containing protein n=1 Tax=Algibacter mikhailovii TaxID=425498 RepID=UPI0024946D94|nr:DUF4249 domain-containing protein [Algibacter mikhailovii]